MNRLVKLLLALGVAVLAYRPVTIQAHEPPDQANFSHHQHLHTGLRITHISYRSPASLAGLERGDLILAVDGRPMRFADDLHRALHATGQRGILTVRDARTGRVRKVCVLPAHGHIGVSVSSINW